uniref:Radical SAM protein n=1 Tax=candidate division WOR-3 bacterium TaxID=2052148 RepID=A0A7V3ZY19_UNCW3
MVIREIRAKNILTKSKVYDWVLNPYIGCQHACTYCYARFMKKFTGHREEWGQFVDVKINAPELLEKEIKRKKRGDIWISGICDPYQPLERKYQLTRRCLGILSNYDWHVFIQTKSPLVLRDLDIIKRFKNIDVGFSIGTANEEIRKIFEPNAPSILSRLTALKTLHENGIRTYVMIAPVLPGAEKLPELIANTVNYVIVDRLNYHYADWVFKKFNLPKIENLDFLVEKLKERGLPVEVVADLNFE